MSLSAKARELEALDVPVRKPNRRDDGPFFGPKYRKKHLTHEELLALNEETKQKSRRIIAELEAEGLLTPKRKNRHGK